VEQIPWNVRRIIYEIFIVDADPESNKNSFIAFCALTRLMDFPEEELSEPDRNERKMLCEMMRRSVLRDDIFQYLEIFHQLCFLNTCDEYSPTEESFRESFDLYCLHFSWFKVVSTYIRNHRPHPVLVDVEPDEVDDQPPEIV